MDTSTPADTVVDKRIIIVGGGFSGLCVAIKLLERGIRDFVVLEKAPRLGGTWRDNTYPGCACDVPSHLYSYSFARKRDWSRVFAEQPEIQRYLLDVAERYQVMPYVSLDTEVLEAVWDDERARWRVATNRGDHWADFLVLAGGPLHEPRIPALPGLDAFAGTTFHSATWRHDHELRDRRVAVIGTGSSAIQLVPRIQPRCGSLSVFQRTAPWVLPKPDWEPSAREVWALTHVPGAQQLMRQLIYALSEGIGIIERNPALMTRLQRVFLTHLERQVPDPALRQALTPHFTLGCKRILLSNTWYPAIQAANTRLVPHAVARVTPTGLVDAAGDAHDVDTIIFGTGFVVMAPDLHRRVVGRDGLTLADRWRKSPQAYLGTTCHGFPNMFFMLGPNLGNGHGSAFTIIEAQTRYLIDAIEQARKESVVSIEVRPAAQRAWNREVQAALATTAFNAGGCASYYLDETGHNPAIYPWTTIDLRRRLRRFDPAPYVMRRAAGPGTGAAHHAAPRRRPTPIPLAAAVVAITGGARGIGLATARRFIDRGAIVAIGDRDHQVAIEAAAALGPDAFALPLDVTSRRSFEAFVAGVEARVGPIDVLVNNAGLMPTGAFLDEPDAVDAAVMGVNHWGTALGMKLVLPAMIARGRGHVVNIASLAGRIQVPYMASYVASKHATVGLTGAVAQEIAGTGVTVGAVLPGAVRTRLSAGIPLEGLAACEPDDVAAAVLESLETRAVEVIVPRLFRPLEPCYALLPIALRHRLHRWLSPRARLLERVSHAERAAYEAEARMQGQALRDDDAAEVA